MTESTVNVPLLRKAVEWAEAEAAKPWELCEWYQDEVESSPELVQQYTGQHKAPECGTCYCIAGYVAALDGVGLTDAHRLGFLSRMHYASSVLGLPVPEGPLTHPLFNAGNTIGDVRRIAEEIAGERL